MPIARDENTPRADDTPCRTTSLWSVGVSVDGPDGLVAAYAAMVAPDRGAACLALSGMLDAVIDGATLFRGFDRSDPFAELLVSPRLAAELAAVAARPALRCHRGYAVRLERRFSA